MRKTVTQVWTEVLPRDDIWQNQNFFDLGGDSLKALEVISRLQALLNIELPLIAFFEDPTIAHLTEVVAALQPATHAPSNGTVASTNDNARAAVARVWMEVLQRENIAPTENFFDLGGDSLKALEVISRLQALLHVEVPLLAFFEDPTIAHAAEVIEELRHSQPQPARAVSEPTGPAPLSFQQLT